jgi:hypothetical protein
LKKLLNVIAAGAPNPAGGVGADLVVVTTATVEIVADNCISLEKFSFSKASKLDAFFCLYSTEWFIIRIDQITCSTLFDYSFSYFYLSTEGFSNRHIPSKEG